MYTIRITVYTTNHTNNNNHTTTNDNHDNVSDTWMARNTHIKHTVDFIL